MFFLQVLTKLTKINRRAVERSPSVRFYLPDFVIRAQVMHATFYVPTINYDRSLACHARHLPLTGIEVMHATFYRPALNYDRSPAYHACHLPLTGMEVFYMPWYNDRPAMDHGGLLVIIG